MPGIGSFWPANARLAISFFLIFEAGGQPICRAGYVTPNLIREGIPELPTNAFFQYGVCLLDRFLSYAKSKSGVWFARKDEIAKWALDNRAHVPFYDRGPPTTRGLSGSEA